MVQLMAWDEVQELIDYGALKESEVKTVWTVSDVPYSCVGSVVRQSLCQLEHVQLVALRCRFC